MAILPSATKKAVTPAARRRFKHPLVIEMDLLVELIGQTKPRENPERLACVLAKIVYLYDILNEKESQDWLLLTCRDWQRRAFWWLSEKQIRDSMRRLEELGYIRSVAAEDTRRGLYVQLTSRCNHPDLHGKGENGTSTLIASRQGKSPTLDTLEEVKEEDISLPAEELETKKKTVAKETTEEKANRVRAAAEKKAKQLEPYTETANKIEELVEAGWRDRGWRLMAKFKPDATADELRKLATLDGIQATDVLELFEYITNDDLYAPRGDFHWLKVLSSPAGWRNVGGNGNMKIINALQQFDTWKSQYTQQGVKNEDRMHTTPREPKKVSVVDYSQSKLKRPIE